MIKLTLKDGSIREIESAASAAAGTFPPASATQSSAPGKSSRDLPAPSAPFRKASSERRTHESDCRTSENPRG